MRTIAVCLLACSLFLAGCSKDKAPAAPQATSAQIHYTVTGIDGAAVVVGYNIPDGSMVTETVDLPFTSPTYTFPAGGWTFINAVYVGLSADITVSIFKNGVLWQTVTAGGLANVGDHVE